MSEGSLLLFLFLFLVPNEKNSNRRARLLRELREEKEKEIASLVERWLGSPVHCSPAAA